MFGPMTPPTFEEIRYQAVTEFDANSPRLRLSIITYLVENGALQELEDAGAVVAAADEMLDFIVEGTSDYFTAIEAAQITTDDLDVEVQGDDEIDGNGYSYL
jgi:hypothetical protein